MKQDKNKQILNKLLVLKEKYYLEPYGDTEEIDDTLEYVKYVKRFFIKLHKNKDINVNLLVNHLIILFNCFNQNYIIKYMIYYINPEHMMYLKTILLYMNKIKEDNPWFEGVPISYDFDYLLKDVNKRVI